jgi:5-methylthioadenosine/S-adenosylhomocysteine deaminase
MLVVVDGRPRYGDADAMTAAGTAPATTLSVSGTERRLAIPNPNDKNEAWQWTDIVSRLDTVRKNPAAALHHAEGRRRSYAGPITAADAPLELTLDMPTGGPIAFAGRPPNPREVVIPPLPTLIHDKAFFDDIHGHGFHGGLLDRLADFYEE